MLPTIDRSGYSLAGLPPALLHMTPLDEDLIERYVRFPSSLKAKDCRAAERLLRTSAAARELAEFFRSFYAELDELEQDDPADAPPPPRDVRRDCGEA